MPEDSFRLVIAGPSGSGKTNTLLHMIYNLLFFDEILLFAKNLHQDKYQFLLHDFAERIDPEVGYKVIETPDEIVPLKALDHESQKVVIFDDYVCEKNQNEIVNYFINGRHHNCSVIYLSQSFLKCQKTSGIQLHIFEFSNFSQKKTKEFLMILG